MKRKIGIFCFIEINSPLQEQKDVSDIVVKKGLHEQEQLIDTNNI